MRFLLSAGVALALVSTGTNVLGQDYLATPIQMQIVAPGGFWAKTFKEMSSSEGQALIAAGCAYFGVKCPPIDWAYAYETVWESDRASINGAVTRAAGNEWNGIWDAPPGYELCNIGDVRWSATSQVNMSLALWKGGPERKGLGFYASVPEWDSGGSQELGVETVALWVPEGRGDADARCVSGSGKVVFQIEWGNALPR